MIKTLKTHKTLKSTLKLSLLIILTLYCTFTIIVSIDLINKVYLLGKKFNLKVEEASLELDDSNLKFTINYTIINPIDIKVKIISIQSIIYSNNIYIWNNIESYYSQEFIIKNEKISKIIKFSIPQEKVKYISNETSIKTYVTCEIMEPKSRIVILEFKETVTINK